MISYPSILLTSLISSRFFCRFCQIFYIDSHVFFEWRWLLPFQSACLSVPFFCLTVLFRTSGTVVNGSGKSEWVSSSCSWHQGKSFILSPFECDVGCGFFINTHCQVEDVAFCSQLAESFIRNRCWILSDAFSASIEVIIWFLFLSLLIYWVTFQILNQSLSSGINPTWSWYIIFFCIRWIHFANILLIVASVTTCVVLYLCRFWYESNAGLMSWEIFPLLHCLEEFV